MFSFLSWIQKLQVKNSYNNSKKINYHSLDLDLYRIFPLGSHINHATPQEQQTCTTGKVTLSYHYTVFLYITNGLYTIFFASTQGRSSCDIVFPVRPGTLPKRPISNPHPLHTDKHLCKLASFSYIRTIYYTSLYNCLKIFDTCQKK